jgi:hypothetical protein
MQPVSRCFRCREQRVTAKFYFAYGWNVDLCWSCFGIVLEQGHPIDGDLGESRSTPVPTAWLVGAGRPES